MATHPKAIDLYCGLGGWAEGFLSEGYDVVGFDIERRPYPGDLVLQDVTTLNGAQFKNTAVIIASPPCQAYSYMAMPWKRAKRMVEEIREGGHYHLMQLNLLFDACFRIQREASEAAGRHIPMVVENVKGAQPWVGRARAHYGSYYLWGDVDSIGGKILVGDLRAENLLVAPKRGGKNSEGGSWFRILDGKPAHGNDPRDLRRDEHGNWVSQDTGVTKNNGGSWFAIANNTENGTGNNPDGRKVHHQREHNSPPGVGQTSWFHGNTKHEKRAVKNGNDWFGSGDDCSLQRKFSSRSEARKHASAVIAKIPFPLAQHIARCFK